MDAALPAATMSSSSSAAAIQDLRAQQAQARAKNASAQPSAKQLFAPPFQSHEKSKLTVMLGQAFGEYDPETMTDPGCHMFVGIGDVPGTPQPKNASSNTSGRDASSGVNVVDVDAAKASHPAAPFHGESPPRRNGIKSLPPRSGGDRDRGADRDRGGDRSRGGGVGVEVRSSSSHDGEPSRRDHRGKKDDRYHKRDSNSTSSDRAGKESVMRMMIMVHDERYHRSIMKEFLIMKTFL